MKSAQNGVATVAITLLLVFVILFSVAFAHRSVLLDARSSANQYRAAQAREAAEAGIEWALAQLNASAPLGSDCLASTDASAQRPRELATTGWRARCVADGSGAWACRCPPADATAPPATAIAFDVVASPAERADTLLIATTGSSGGTQSHLRVQVGRLPGLDTPPAAALTVRGSAQFSGGGFTLHHADTDLNGITLHSGGSAETQDLLLRGTPGTPALATVASEDPALAALAPTGLFASLFRLSPDSWRAQPTAHELDCSQPCGPALAQAASHHQLLWLRGGLKLDTPIELGTPQRPVLLVMDGPAELLAHLRVHGLVYGRDAHWVDAGNAVIHGAVVIDGDLRASGRTQVHHDASVLDALRRHTGSYARVSGSWRDH